jgi:outer membrane protein assembly factor BamE (lipoprotein component of BamABCDE complex)
MTRQGKRVAMTLGGIRKGGMTIALMLALGACAGTFRDHGYAPDDETLDQIVVGVDTRDTVAEVVGQPSSAGILNEGGWYYVSSRYRNYTYNAPEEIDRQVVAITFDQGGVVENVERFGLAEGQVVPLSRRVTDSNIKGTTFIRQLLGNLGRLDPTQFLGR